MAGDVHSHCSWFANLAYTALNLGDTGVRLRRHGWVRSKLTGFNVGGGYLRLRSSSIVVDEDRVRWRRCSTTALFLDGGTRIRLQLGRPLTEACGRVRPRFLGLTTTQDTRLRSSLSMVVLGYAQG